MQMVKNLLWQQRRHKANKDDLYQIKVAMFALSLFCCLAWPKPKQRTMSLPGAQCMRVPDSGLFTFPSFLHTQQIFPVKQREFCASNMGLEE